MDHSDIQVFTFKSNFQKILRRRHHLSSQHKATQIFYFHFHLRQGTLHKKKPQPHNSAGNLLCISLQRLQLRVKVPWRSSQSSNCFTMKNILVPHNSDRLSISYAGTFDRQSEPVCKYYSTIANIFLQYVHLIAGAVAVRASRADTCAPTNQQRPDGIMTLILRGILFIRKINTQRVMTYSEEVLSRVLSTYVRRARTYHTKCTLTQRHQVPLQFHLTSVARLRKRTFMNISRSL